MKEDSNNFSQYSGCQTRNQLLIVGYYSNLALFNIINGFVKFQTQLHPEVLRAPTDFEVKKRGHMASSFLLTYSKYDSHELIETVCYDLMVLQLSVIIKISE